MGGGREEQPPRDISYLTKKKIIVFVGGKSWPRVGRLGRTERENPDDRWDSHRGREEQPPRDISPPKIFQMRNPLDFR